MDGTFSRRTYLLSISVPLTGLAGCIADAPEEAATDTDDVADSSNTSVETPTASRTETGEPTKAPGPPTTETVTNDAPTATELETDAPESTRTETPTRTRTATPPAQPKIREVTDGFGHTLSFSDDDYPGDPVSRATVDDEVVVEDGLEVRLCVTDVDARPDDDLTYAYRFGHTRTDHPDNPRVTDRVDADCWTWEMRREDYQSAWTFMVWVRNGDDMYYQNQSVESDYRVDIEYTNLTLAE